MVLFVIKGDIQPLLWLIRIFGHVSFLIHWKDWSLN